MWSAAIFVGIYSLLWYELYKFFQSILKDTFSSAQIHNFASIYHNVVSVAYIFFYLWNPWNEYINALMIWSISYYLFDLRNYENRKDKYLMIAHHIGSIIVELYLHNLYLDPDDVNGRAVLMGLLSAELSNYPLYVIHHMKHPLNNSSKNEKIHKGWYRLNALSFLIFRGPVGFYYLFIAPVPLTSLWCLIWIFWVMSFYWVYLMLKK